MSPLPRPSSRSKHQNQTLTFTTTQLGNRLHKAMPLRQRRRLIIAKFGGSNLSNGKKITPAAQSVARENSQGNRLVPVVRAGGRTSDKPLQLTQHRGGRGEKQKD